MAITSGNSINTQNTLVFIDGKNLVCRFQKMAEEKNIILDIAENDNFLKKRRIEYEQNKFVWSRIIKIDFPELGHNKKFDVIRAYYYTFCDPNNSNGLSEKISKIPISSNNQLTLNPIVLHGIKANRNFKGDDIQICIDSIEHAINSNVEAFYFFTGDGDFLPLIEKLQKMGRYVFVAAFSSGLNDKLKIKPDFFSCLDRKFGFLDKT